jgi:hypothetical protein
MMEEKIKKDLEQTTNGPGNIINNMSRFYTKTNKVIGIHPNIV